MERRRLERTQLRRLVREGEAEVQVAGRVGARGRKTVANRRLRAANDVAGVEVENPHVLRNTTYGIRSA